MRWLVGIVLAAVVAAAGIALGLVLTGTTRSKERVRPIGQVIRWTDNVVKPTRYVPPVPKGAPPCTGRRVRFRYAGAVGVNSTQVNMWLAVRNVGKATCALAGRPSISTMSTVPLRVGRLNPRAGDPVLWVAGFPARGARFGLKPGQTAEAGMNNFYICSHYPPAAPRMTATLMGVNRIRFRVSACRKAGGRLDVGPWSPPPQHIRIRAPLRIELRLPRVAVVHRDGQLHYAIRLTNTGSHVFRFPSGSCPDYSLWISGSGSYSWTLSCRAMRPLGPGKTAIFRLQEDWAIMDHLEPGRHKIGWRLHAGRRRDLGTRGELEIKYKHPIHA